MNISTQRQLITLLTLVIGSTALIVYLKQRAIATETRYNPPHVEQSMPSLPGKLALNQSQQESIVLINQKLSQQIEEILTDEQLQNFTATISQGLTLKFALQALSLSSEQSDRLHIALKSARKEIEQVLTPEQLEYIRQQHRNPQHLTTELL